MVKQNSIESEWKRIRLKIGPYAQAIIVFLVASLGVAHATSYLFTLEHKVARCTAILQVSLTDVIPPKSQKVLDPAVCRAKVLDILKGSPEMKEVEFLFYPYGTYSRDVLAEMKGKEYLVFLHQPPMPDHPGQLWVFGGPRGILPIATEYKDYKSTSDNHMVAETFSHSNYVATIRKLSLLGATNTVTRTR